MDAGTDLVAKHDAARSGRQRGGDVRLVADDGDRRHGQGAKLGEAREGLLGVDAGIPERDLRVVLFDDVDRAGLREQARQPRAHQGSSVRSATLIGSVTGVIES